jgi:hypothetical protein
MHVEMETEGPDVPKQTEFRLTGNCQVALCCEGEWFESTAMRGAGVSARPLSKLGV